MRRIYKQSNSSGIFILSLRKKIKMIRMGRIIYRPIGKLFTLVKLQPNTAKNKNLICFTSNNRWWRRN